jgi:cell division protein FtsB
MEVFMEVPGNLPCKERAAGYWKEGINMPWLKTACGCLLAGVVATAVMQRKSISSMRSANADLQRQNEEAAQLTGENADLTKLRAVNQEVSALIESNKDLPRLRNEVRQLRQAKSEIEKLRAENARLAAAANFGTNSARPRLAEMEGYVAKEAWVNAGFATPEATIQTFFWAAQQGNLQRMAECMTPASRRGFEMEFEGKTDEQRTKMFEEGLAKLLRIGGYRIAERQQTSESEIVLGIQAAAGGRAIQFGVYRIGSEWKLGEPK